MTAYRDGVSSDAQELPAKLAGQKRVLAITIWSGVSVTSIVAG